MRHGRPHLTESRKQYTRVHDRIAREAETARQRQRAQDTGTEPGETKEEDRETR